MERTQTNQCRKVLLQNHMMRTTGSCEHVAFSSVKVSTEKGGVAILRVVKDRNAFLIILPLEVLQLFPESTGVLFGQHVVHLCDEIIQ
jgi:hypothetical protein